MPRPGVYRPDPSQGITRPEDLPQPQLIYSRRDTKQYPCPRCGRHAYRDKSQQRTLHDLGDLDTWCPRDLVITSSQHYCTKCRKYFSLDLSDLAPPGSHYTHRVIDLAVRIVVEDGLPYRPASWHLWRDHRVFVPFATIQPWVEAGEKKGPGAHGQGPDVSRRQAAALHLECCRAGQPALSQDAKASLPRACARADQDSLGAGHVA